MLAEKNPFSGIESPFFWPVGLALRMEKTAWDTMEEGLSLFKEKVAEQRQTEPMPWATPNSIVGNLRSLTLRNFSSAPANEEIPTLIIPPHTGQASSIADFQKKQSIVETLLANGLTRLFCVDWRGATEETKNDDLSTYLSDLNIAVSDLGGRVRLVGLSQGGWIASLYAARFPKQVERMVCAGSPLDTYAGNGAFRALARDLPLSFYENLVKAGGGRLRTNLMLEGFDCMGPSQHLTNKFLSLYEHIDDPTYNQRAETFERWYATTQDLSGRWYMQVVQSLYKENRFAKGEFFALGRSIKPSTITCPVYLLAGKTDALAPQEQVFGVAKLLGTPPTSVLKDLASTGHLGLFMGSRTMRENWSKIAVWLVMKDA